MAKKSYTFPFIAVILVWSLVVGWLMTGIFQTPALAVSPEPVPASFQIGQQLYLENCAGCHVPFPPGVLPSESWLKIMENPGKHYGVEVPNIIRLTQRLIWEYLKAFSRPLVADEPVPVYIAQSRYFKALHPRVTLPESVNHQSCVVCHLNAASYDYQTLTPAWDNSL
ncbi:MAG: hypothetical protein N5P05_001799 [Chroococcopsis gigantea SAG 12.99]|nr:hypothetical protein [Chroococcopsis gigantea SAG 12.99]